MLFDKSNISEMYANIFPFLIGLLTILFGYTTFRITSLDSKRNNIILIINDISGLIMNFINNMDYNATSVFSKISENPKVIKLAGIIKDDTSRNNIDVLKEEIVLSAANELLFKIKEFETPYKICLLKLEVYLPISVSMFDKVLKDLMMTGKFLDKTKLENELESCLKSCISDIAKNKLDFYKSFESDISSSISSQFRNNYQVYKNDLKVKNALNSATNFVILYFDFLKELDSYEIEKWSDRENCLKSNKKKYLADINKKLLKRFEKREDLSQMIEFYLNEN